MTKQLFINVTLFCIIAVCSFLMFLHSARVITLKHQQKVELLERVNASQAWYLADEKRKNAAHREYIAEMNKWRRPVTVMDPPDPKPLEITAGVKE